jgi:hypothetical protein
MKESEEFWHGSDDDGVKVGEISPVSPQAFRHDRAAPHRAVLAGPADPDREDAAIDGREGLGGQAIEPDARRAVAGGTRQSGSIDNIYPA